MIKLFFIISLVLFQIKNLSVIEKLQQKFETINYLQADFSQSAGSKKFLRGKFYFSKENNYRIELTNNTIISDGLSIWNVDKKRNKVIISNLDEDPLAFSLYDYIYSYPAKCEIKEEKLKDGYFITLLVKNNDLNFESAKLYVNKDYLINKIAVTDFGGDTFILTFNNIKVNNAINKSFFTYKDNDINKIIDLR